MNQHMINVVGTRIFPISDCKKCGKIFWSIEIDGKLNGHHYDKMIKLNRCNISNSEWRMREILG